MLICFGNKRIERIGLNFHNFFKSISFEEMNKLRVLIISFFLVGCASEFSSVENPENDQIPVVQIQLNDDLGYVSKEEYSSGTIQIESANENDRIGPSSVKLRGRGNTSWSFPKKPFQLKFNEPHEVLGMPYSKKWLLMAHYSDKSLLRTELAFDLSRESRLNWTSGSRFVELIINEEYLGLYQLVEKIESTHNRLNSGQGFVLEVNRPNRQGPDDVVFKSNFHEYTIKDPEVVNGDFEFELIKDYIITCEEVLFGPDFRDSILGYHSYIDIYSFVDWYIIHEITKNSESAWSSSCYLNYVPGEKLKMGPVWDFDLSLGNNYAARPTSGFVIKDAGWYSRLFQDSIFVECVKERFDYFYLQKSEFIATIEQHASDIDGAQQRNFIKWPILGVWVWPNAVSFTEYEHEVSYLSDWFSDRMDWLEGAIENL